MTMVTMTKMTDNNDKNNDYDNDNGNKDWQKWQWQQQWPITMTTDYNNDQ